MEWDVWVLGMHAPVSGALAFRLFAVLPIGFRSAVFPTSPSNSSPFGWGQGAAWCRLVVVQAALATVAAANKIVYDT